jgi:hypothetical protein
MASRPIRLETSFAGQGAVAHWLVQARRAVPIGFAAALIIDHPGNTALLSPLVAIT